MLVLANLLNPCQTGAGRIVRAGVYEAGTLANFDKNGSAHGFFVDMLNRIAEKEQWNVQYVPGSWQEGLDRLKSDNIDVVLCIGYTPEREKYMDFPKEYLLLNWGVLYRPKGSHITSLLDLEGKTVSALKGDVYLAGFLELIRQFNVHVKIEEVDKYSKVFKAVESGAVAAGVAGNLYGILNEDGRKTDQTPVIFSPIKVGYAVNEGKNGDLIAAFDRHIAEMKADKASAYHHEIEHLLGKKDTQIPKEAYWALSGVVAALLIAVIWSVTLKRQVRTKTEDLVAEIAERKLTENELRESTARFQAFYDLGLVGLTITAPDKGWSTINDCLCNMLGYSEAELREMTWAQLTHPDDLAADIEQFDRVLIGEIDGYELDKRFLKRSGEILFAKLVVRCVRKPDQSVDFIVAMIQDITKSKQIENELRDAEWKFRALFNNGPIGVAYHQMIYDELGTPVDYLFIDANSNYLNLTGVDPRGKTVTEAFPGIENDPFNWIGVFGRVAKSGESVHFQQHLQTNDRWYDVVGYQYKPDHFVTSFVEITDRKRTEESLRMSEERFRNYVNLSPNAVFVADQNGQYIDVNPAASTITGYSADELLNMNILDLLPPESLEWGQKNFQQLLETGYSTGEAAYRKKNGELGHWSLAAVRLTPTKFMGIVTDMTDRKLNEDQLRDSEERYRGLVKHLSSGVVVHAVNTTIIFSNPMASTILGLSKDQLRGRDAIDPAWSFIQENGATLALEEYPVNKVISSGQPVSNQVLGINRPDLPDPVWVQCNSYPVAAEDGTLLQVVVTFTDITERKRDKEIIEKRLIALTQPLEAGSVAFNELFNIDDVQRLQDEFAKATGVASIITDPDGIPLTAPSNFTRLCNDIIRKTEKGCASCYKSDAALGRFNPDGPNIQPCLSGGLWDAGAGITVGGQHIANWLIGQVRDETQSEEKMAAYAREIEVNEEAFLDAFREVPSMSRTQFEQIAQALFTLANQLSTTAYQNIQQARFINERKAAEESLRNSEEMYRALSNELQTILNTSPVGICLLKNRKVVRANAAFDSIFGYEAGTTVNIDTVAFYSSEELYEETGRVAYQLLLQGGSYTKDVLMRKKDGVLFWCSISGHAITHGNLEEGTIWIIQDISERKQSENEMLSLMQRLQLATSSARLGIWDWNVKENTMVWDDRMFELYGITREAFPNSIDAWMNGLHLEDKEGAIAECQAALNGEKEFDTEFRVLHPDGTVKYLRGKGLVVRGVNGNAERMLGINYDVTKAKRAEEEKHKLESQLQQAQKMESVGRLAGGIAHDFNNMLTVIQGYSQLGLIESNETSPYHHFFEEINNATVRSADLTKQLLAFARKQVIAPKALDLNKTISDMLKMLQRLIGESIHLAWQSAPDLWPVKADPSQLDQILANLCVNAKDAIKNTGQITISTRNNTIDTDFCQKHPYALPGEYVHLSVSDDGSGMDKETIDHIFEPFFTTKAQGEGTGLGLATVYGIVKQNNGFITINSEPGQGTTIAIHLPRHIGTVEHTSKESIDIPASIGHETILLVEDEPAILDMTSKILEIFGYTVLQASTPLEATRIAEEHDGKITMLITDVIMPGMNGKDLATKLHSFNPQLKCLFMSGYTADAISQHGVLEEGLYFIQKPFLLPDLAHKVREVIDGT